MWPTTATSSIHPGRPLLALLILPLLAACSTSGSVGSASPGSAASETSVATAIETTAASEAASASETELPTAVPTAVDPCDLVTSQEASQLAGTTFGEGTSQTTATNVRQCIYGSQTADVFSVSEVEAPDDATLEAAKAQVLSALQAAANGSEITVQPVVLGDAAAILSGSYSGAGHTISISGIYVLKGRIFFSFANVAVDHAVPTADLLKTQAQTSLDRLP